MKSTIKTVGLLVLGSILQLSTVQAENLKSSELMTLSKLLKDKAVVAKQIEKFDKMNKINPLIYVYNDNEIFIDLSLCDDEFF